MALILKYIDSIHRYMETNGDERTKDWPMMSSPFPTLAVCLTYVYVVKVLGPRLMENRKPFQLQNVMLIYNAVQVIFSTWLFYEIAFSGWLTGDYNLRCQPVDYSNNPRTLRMVHACWWYYFSKFTEFFDTIFFVLRKKNSQVSTLHVIHHGCMPMSVWFGVKFTPGGHSTFFGLLNTFVHIVMYFYYMMSALGPSVRPYLWWKKYLTTLQMAQFILIMLHAFQLLFIDCNYPKAFVWWIGMHAVMFFFLFNEFYKNAYKSRRTQYKNLLMFLLQRREKEVYGTSSAVVNGDESHQLLLANGHHSKTNGHVQSNGYANGKINGANNGLTNGYKYDQLSNGQATHMSNGKVSSSSTYKNGHAVLVANGGFTQTELIQRKQTDK